MVFKSLLFTAVLVFAFSASAQDVIQPTEREPAGANFKSPTPRHYLSPEDQDVLARGEISTGRYILGGVLSIWPGLGIGQAVQLRYMDRGWIFTVGELGSATVAVVGLAQCMGDTLVEHTCDSSLMTLGLAGLAVFKIWEVVDAWAVPPQLNDRYRYLKAQSHQVSFYGAPIPTRDGMLMAFGMTF